MAERVQTLLQLHLSDLRRRYMEAHDEGMKALSAGDIEAFENAIRQERAIIDEWVSALESYFEHHVRPLSQPPRLHLTRKRLRPATRR
jgi:hypothetical protein